MTRTEIGKRVVVYGGVIKLRCPRCRAEKLPEEYYRSGSLKDGGATLGRRSLCIACFKGYSAERWDLATPEQRAKWRANARMRYTPTGRPRGRPKGFVPTERDRIRWDKQNERGAIVSVAEARIRAARLARGLDMDTGLDKAQRV